MLVIGGALLLAAIIWMAIIGFYPDQLPIIIVMVVAGALLAWQGQRARDAAKRANALNRIAARDKGAE